MQPITQYVGLDVSLDETKACVVDEAGRTLWRGCCTSTPDEIEQLVRKHAPNAVRVGLETGMLSVWLFHELKKRRVPVICIDARHAKAALSLQINKTDANDAHGIAQVVRVGWYRQVLVKSMDTYAVRAMISARSQLVSTALKIKNTVRGLLKTFGLILKIGSQRRYIGIVRAAIQDNPVLLTIVEPMLIALNTLQEQIAVFDRALCRRASADPIAKRLMSAPGVGVIVALSYISTVEDPHRFRRSRTVAAYLGLTPRRFQSGETDRPGGISRAGDPAMRTLLYEAACVVLRRCSRPSPLQQWGRSLIERLGSKRAMVAVARKLAVILHHMWRDGTAFQWSPRAAIA
ncbi:IS110 family transposase [Bradyrhizobium sp. I1.7.5]|uniref:IS110 family transposase n=1 Tax=Bradyrhizobium sp. I1.7.5 TaxID=3156363 RepID=UPI003397EA69